MSIFDRILKAYALKEYVINLKARFVLYAYLIVIGVNIIAFSSTIYTSNILLTNIPLVISYLSAFLFLVGGLVVLSKGRYTIAAHLLIVCSITFVWLNSLVSKTAVDSFMDTMIFIIALLSLLPLVITQKSKIIFIYAFVNVLILFLFVLSFGREIGLSEEEVITYLTDNTIAIIAVTIVAWQIFTINKRALDKAEYDFKARIKAESQLKASELFKKRVFESSRIPIVIMDTVGYHFIEFNDAALASYGFKSREDLLGKTPYDVSAQTQYDGSLSKDKALVYINKALSEGAVVFEWKHQRVNGELWDAEVHLLAFTSEDETFLQFSLLDVTQRKTAENELAEYRIHLEKLVQERTEELNASNKELVTLNEELYMQREALEVSLKRLESAQDQLVNSEKMASLGILAAGVAHEINNPLNYICNGTSAIEKYLEENSSAELENLKPLFEAVNTGVDRVTTIVKSMGRYSRSENLPFTNCNIQVIIDDCLVILHNQYKGRVEIKKNYLENMPDVVGNDGQLHQAFLNIIVNAIQAIEHNGVVGITVTHNKTDIMISVADTGIGISDELQKHIFDPFFTTKNPGKGTGLGLSITKKIIDEHKGVISCSSMEHKGTVINVSIPLKRW